MSNCLGRYKTDVANSTLVWESHRAGIAGGWWVLRLRVRKGPDLGALDVVLTSWLLSAFREKLFDVLK